MKKLIMSSFLVAAMFGFNACDMRSPMSAEERTKFENSIKFANKKMLEQEYLYAYANNETEKLAYFTDEVLLPGDKLKQETNWQQQKAVIDKMMLDLSTGTLKPTKAELQALIAQVNNVATLRFDYIREVLLPELQKLVEEKK